MNFPFMVRIKQHFETNPIKNIGSAVRQELERLRLREIIFPGQSVCITAGSRGIANIQAVLAEVVDVIRGLGAKPFIVPAMGSHGGATAEGQRRVLEHYGITEEKVNAPIISSLQVVEVGSTPDGIPVFVDRNAWEADHIVVVNRVKPHTDFHAEIESGLIKMLAIGLGKQKGAERYHKAIVRLGHIRVLLDVARLVLDKCSVAFGLGIVENQLDETQIIRAAPAHEIEQMERELLVQAKQLFPRLPVEEIDLLIVDNMGKDISGTGMDQNVIGRSTVAYHRPSDKPRIMRIFVRDLTQESDGNAVGLGNADFTTTRLVDRIDRQATYMNCLTSNAPEIVRIPPFFDTDQEAIEAALRTIGDVKPSDARVVHISDTAHLENMNISLSLLPEVKRMDSISIMGEPFPMTFDQKGNLTSSPHQHNGPESP